MKKRAIFLLMAAVLSMGGITACSKNDNGNGKEVQETNSGDTAQNNTSAEYTHYDEYTIVYEPEAQVDFNSDPYYGYGTIKILGGNGEVIKTIEEAVTPHYNSSEHTYSADEGVVVITYDEIDFNTSLTTESGETLASVKKYSSHILDLETMEYLEWAEDEEIQYKSGPNFLACDGRIFDKDGNTIHVRIDKSPSYETGWHALNYVEDETGSYYWEEIESHAEPKKYETFYIIYDEKFEAVVNIVVCETEEKLFDISDKLEKYYANGDKK